MIKISNLLKEIIDIYSPEELNLKGIEFSIETDSAKRFRVNLKYKDQYYKLAILPIFNPNQPVINFGNTDENYDNINLSELLKSPYSSKILAAIFGLIRYWVDKYDIQRFEYAAEGKVRVSLYNYYLTKHFSDFKNRQEQDGSLTIQIWEKKV